jgi:hypothetical protein
LKHLNAFDEQYNKMNIDARSAAFFGFAVEKI